MSDGTRHLATAPGQNAVPVDSSTAAGPDFAKNPRARLYLQGVLDCLEVGQVPSDGRVAAKIHKSRETVFGWRKRWPGLTLWASEQLRSQAAGLVGPVLMRIGRKAIERASVSHAELFLRAVGELDDGRPRGALVQVNVVGAIQAPAGPRALADWPGGHLEDGTSSPKV